MADVDYRVGLEAEQMRKELRGIRISLSLIAEIMARDLTSQEYQALVQKVVNAK